MYKFGARYSRRSIDEVKEDIRRAKLIDDLMFEHGIGAVLYHDGEYLRAERLVEEIEHARWEAGILEEDGQEETAADLDPRLAWFLPWFRDKPGLKDSFRHILSWRISGARTCFLGDADSLILKPGFLGEAIREVKMNFPSVSRFTVYGRTCSAAGIRSLKELREMRQAGLGRVHFGLESGSDRVLHFVNKGVTKQEHIEGALKTKEAGLSCSLYVMPGLGGAGLSEEHACETADAVTRISPDFVRLRSLQVFPGTPLEKRLRDGDFREADEEQVVREIRTIVEKVDCRVEILSDSASNLLTVQGRLPEDRASMLSDIDSYLGLSRREKLEFSMKARISSFHGQYGGLSRDVYQYIRPYLRGNSLDLSTASDEALCTGIAMIREKLMP